MSSELSPADAELVESIIEDLRAKGQYTRHFGEHEGDAIERTRRLGRRAGRELGWKVRTFATDPSRREDRNVVVIVVIVESSPLHEQLMDIRGSKAIRKAMDSWTLGGHDG